MRISAKGDTRVHEYSMLPAAQRLRSISFENELRKLSHITTAAGVRATRATVRRLQDARDEHTLSVDQLTACTYEHLSSITKRIARQLLPALLNENICYNCRCGAAFQLNEEFTFVAIVSVCNLTLIKNSKLIRLQRKIFYQSTIKCKGRKTLAYEQ